MNRYQKVITCVIRFISVALVLYSLGVTVVTLLMSAPLWRLTLVVTVPMFIVGLFLFATAIPLAKIITLGVRDY